MKLFDVRVSKKFVTSLSITDHLPPSTAGYLGDLLRAEPDLHEHGALLRHRVPPQVPLSVHRLSSKVSLLNKKNILIKKEGFVLQEGGGRGLAPLNPPRAAPELDPGLSVSIQQLN